ncbi:MAG: hypothetical protein J1E07_10880 [Treponema sp.]|nr:hypothetical protein [Treponema sp.]
MPITAKELMEKLAKDKDYQERARKKKAKILEAAAKLDKEYKPFSRECKRAGHSVETAWDLLPVKKPYPELMPILMKYLEEKNHSPRFRDGVARAMAVPEASPYFDRILAQYYDAKDEHETVRWAIALAICESARTQEQLDVVEQMIYDEKVGNDRNALLGAIKRMKGEQKKRCLAYVNDTEALRINLHSR